MKNPRNPFRLRRSENIDADTAFLNLFEPGILDILPAHSWKDSVQIIRSAAGGGKTSLIRLFAPKVLHTLHSLHTRNAAEQSEELFQKLKEMGAIDESGPKILGATLICDRSYSRLQDLPLDDFRKTRLFFGLLDARIVLVVLHNAIAFSRLQLKDLSRIHLTASDPSLRIPGLDTPCDGLQLFDWAEKLEAQLCNSLDSFGPLQVESLPGHDTLLSLKLIRAEALLLDDRPIADRVLLMMDDIQQLTSDQRTRLIETVIESRSSVGVWIAERFEALSTRDMLASGNNEGRDYNEPISIEKYWRPKFSRFEKLAIKIADRRVQFAADTETKAFRACMDETIDIPQYEHLFVRARREIEDRVRARAASSKRFDEWIAIREQMKESPKELAVAWRSLEILIERELRRPQKSLFDDIMLEEDELQEKSDSSLRNAADLFLAKEYDLPYYFGSDCIARLASLNIKQFLGLSGEIFEESVASELLNRSSSLSPERQHKLMKRAAKAMWDDIPSGVGRGRQLRNFLEAVGQFAHWYTYRPTAPNDPGVGGTAIRMSERAMLMSDEYLEHRPSHRRFADILASALAHNLLVADLDYKCKGERWMVLNLNRLLCVHFDLPLHYGLYKERPIAELVKWVDKRFVDPDSEGGLL